MSTKTNTIEKNGSVKLYPTETQRKSNGKDKNSGIGSICSRALKANSEWPDKDEFLDVIYWARQVVGILGGILWGIFPLKGIIGLALFAGISCLLVYLYSNYQSIDEEAYGGIWELMKEGFMTSFAGFLVTWIILYTGLHHESATVKDY